MAAIGLPRERSRHRTHTTIAEDAAARGHSTTHAIDGPAMKRLKPTTAEGPSAPPKKAALQQQGSIHLSIKATSIFSPATWDCAHCHERNSFGNRLCHGPGCRSQFSWRYTMLTRTGAQVDLARFPVHWVCGRCDEIHSVLDIIEGNVHCDCARPELRAVYDQFGDLVLYWRDDDQVKDLREGRKVEEAARRLWIAGGERWADVMPRILLDDDGKKGKGREMVTVLVGKRVLC